MMMRIELRPVSASVPGRPSLTVGRPTRNKKGGTPAAVPPGQPEVQDFHEDGGWDYMGLAAFVLWDLSLQQYYVVRVRTSHLLSHCH
jgi:hypothetical protein